MGNMPVGFALELDESRPPYTVMALKGEVDVGTVAVVREKLVDLASRGQNQLVVDLEGASFLDSVGLSVLVAGLKRARSQGGELALVSTRPVILNVLQVTGLTRVFPIFGTVDEATRPEAR
ncbi:MAG TPA: STAS domain-containing protein [Acidimicrobiales bacterium]|nr:STAS domain-containing protein [Acidimicrobiales bacterium]